MTDRDDNLSTKEWNAARWQQLRVHPEPEPAPLPEPVPATAEEAEEWAHAEKFMADLVVQGYELIREEAEEILRVNPDDETAKVQLLKYKQYMRSLRNPKPFGLVITQKKESTTLEDRIGVWKNVAGVWLVRIGKSQVGDKVRIKRADGTYQKVRLTQETSANEYRAVEI
jgi:hypothetical protein